MPKFLNLVMLSLTGFVLGSCNDVSLGSDELDAGSGGQGGATGGNNGAGGYVGGGGTGGTGGTTACPVGQLLCQLCGTTSCWQVEVCPLATCALPDAGSDENVAQVDTGIDSSPVSTSCDPGATLIGASYNLSLSHFAFGSTPVRDDTTVAGLTRWVGTDGVVGIYSCGEEMGSMNADAPETGLPDWSSDSSALSEHVRAYWVSMGVDPCQIAEIQVQAGTNGYSISLVRGVDGITIAESNAGAKFNVNDQTTSEILYWPTIPAETVTAARSFRSLLADPAALATYKAKLPATAQGDGVVTIHHAECPSLYYAPSTPVATYDVSTGSWYSSFDIDGNRVSTDLSPISP